MVCVLETFFIIKNFNYNSHMWGSALDGSYTFGYEAADGSFKIETKSATGEVKGRENVHSLET